MNGFDLHATLGDHIGSNRGVDTAAQQAHGSAAHTGGQAAGTGLGRAVDIGCQVTHFHIHGVIGMMHIHGGGGMGFCQTAADLLGQLNGVQGEPLVRALGFHLEALGAIQIVAQIVFNGLKNGVAVFFAGAAAAQRNHTENGMAGVPGTIHITFVIHGLYINGRLQQIHIEFTEGAHTAADIGAELVFKLALVSTLQDDLAQFQQKNFFHNYLSN